MPELPEVETPRRGIATHITGKRVTRVIVRESRLRWPVPKRLAKEITGQTIEVTNYVQASQLTELLNLEA